MANLKIGIIGTGRVGGAIAYAMLFHPKVAEIWLHDIDLKRLMGEQEDLQQAAMFINPVKRIIRTPDLRSFMSTEYKYIFICTGFARQNSLEKMSGLYQKNVKIVAGIIGKITDVAAHAEEQGRLKGAVDDIKSRIYVVTNPSDEIAKTLGTRYLGGALDRMRHNTNSHDGPWILDRKGYTNWGIAGEAFRTVK
jgi:malate/lactate dehydrogenase